MTSVDGSSRGRSLIGRVVSARTRFTLTVEVERLVLHPRVRKYVSRRKNFKAHDVSGDFHEGDVVVIRECRPTSRSKRWVVVGLAR